MKIELVGTGSIGAIESSACALIDDKLLIDAGNGIVKKLKQTGHKISDIENCLITHLHGDHFVDIVFLMFDRYFYEPENILKIYGPKGLENRVKQLFEIMFPGDYEKIEPVAKIKFIEFEELKSEKIDDNTYVTSFEVEHGNCKPAYGYVIEKENHKVGFSGDSKYCNAIDEIIKQSDISVLDMSFMESRGGHMGLEDITMLTEKYPNKLIVSTHMQDYVREQAKLKNIKNLIVSDDGQIIEL